jgi:16S rRNA (adenine1518-N6/adenine1519-N6)-dimethyltransferase
MHPKTILERRGLHPKKSLGQNFIFDDNVLTAIVAAAQLRADDNVLEIGPGLGALTRRLAQSAGQVVAVELDGRLLPILEQELHHIPNVRLLHGDILEQTPADWFGSARYQVVANVPYYITGAILRHLFTVSPRPDTVTLTVQQEVAQRLAAAPGEMSLLAVSVQCFGVVEVARSIKAGAFWPRPEVDSAVVHIRLRRPPLIAPEEEQAFFRLVRAGFSQKRKQIQKNLRVLGLSGEAITAALTAAGIDGSRRAETLSLDDWVTLLHWLPR